MKSINNHIQVVVHWGLLVTMAAGVVPPKVPGLSLPVDMLENIRTDPGYYMPGRALTGLVQARKLAKRAVDGTFQLPDTMLAVLPVLCMQYADVEEAEWPISQMQEQLFGEWGSGTMRDYYLETSYGALEVTGDVIGWVQVSGTSQYYERDNGNTGALIREALDLSDGDTDYSRYDNDGPDGIPNSGDDDGYVDTIMLIHSGIGGEYGGPEIWSHSSSISDYTTDDPSAAGGFIKVSGYIIQPAVNPQGTMEAIGVFCHEFGHALGLPDLYDRDQSSEGIGNWGLMAGGGGESTRPSHMSAWSKEVLGWIEPIVVPVNFYGLPIPAVVDTPVVYKVWTHSQIQPFTYSRGGLSASVGLEYFLVENRRRKGFDDYLPGEGLLIWHIRNDVSTQNDDEYNKLVDLEAADNTGGLDRGVNRGDAGDPYPGNSGNRAFNRGSLPSSDTRDGGYSKVAVEHISDPGDTMYADLSVVANDLVYLGNTVDDAGGDNNGYVDPGETVILSLELHNLGLDIAQMQFTLATEDQAVTIIDSVATYSNIPEDSTVSGSPDDFAFTVAAGTGYHPLRFRVTGSDGGNHAEVYDLVVMMENLNILLVDDSGEEADELGQSISSYYREAFEIAGIPYYSPWSRTVDGLPSTATLNQYRTIVWMTGSSRETLDEIEQVNLKAYLDGGGSLLISGQNLGFDLAGALSSASDSLFYTGYLKARYERDAPYDDATTIMLTGVAGDPISKGFRYPKYFFLSGGTSAGNQTSPDLIAPIGSAVGTIEYFGTGVMGKSAGIRYAGDDYRLVYLSFGLEGVNDAGNAPISREELLARAMGWLQEDPRILAIEEQPDFISPQEFTLEQNYPNPFNATTSIPYRLGESGMVELAIYDILGREVFSARRTHSGPGRYVYTWQGRDRNGISVPSGVYLYRLKFKDRDRVRKLLLLK